MAADELNFTGIEWKPGEKPRVNVWYRSRDYEDMYCIRPDYKLKKSSFIRSWFTFMAIVFAAVSRYINCNRL